MTTDDHFARVFPIVEQRLFNKRVAILGDSAAVAPLVRYLAANGVGKWCWITDDVTQVAMLRAELAAQHGNALPLDVATTIRDGELPHIVVAVGSETWQTAQSSATFHQIPFIAVDVPHSLYINHLPLSKVERGQGGEVWDWRVKAPLVAYIIRAVLLGQPVEASYRWDDNDHTTFTTPTTRRGTILIAGLGSIGSIAAQYLAPYSNTLVLADPDTVDPYNPVRQAYPIATIGQPKALALQSVIRNVVPVPEALTDNTQITTLVEERAITAALIATGTNADFTIARVLYDYGIPHVVGRCYPRARYWEGIVVDHNTPAFEEMRGHLYVGPAAPPTPEQQRAYSDAGALEAEPATLIESGWAAAWLARLTWQLAQPVALREAWFLRHLAGQHTCFLGGLAVEQTPHGPAYGISALGQVRTYGVAAIAR